MMYSVMNTRSRQYDYYDDGKTEPWHTGKPVQPSAASSLGAVPEEAAWRLPSGAKYIGSGDTAKGHVASSSRGFGGLGDIFPKDWADNVWTISAVAIGISWLWRRPFSPVKRRSR